MTEDELFMAHGMDPSRIHSGGTASRAVLALLFERTPAPVCPCGGRVYRGVTGPMQASPGHIIPVARGGTDELVNLRIEHLRCNVRRQARLDSPIATIAKVVDRS